MFKYVINATNSNEVAIEQSTERREEKSYRWRKNVRERRKAPSSPFGMLGGQGFNH